MGRSVDGVDGSDAEDAANEDAREEHPKREKAPTAKTKITTERFDRAREKEADVHGWETAVAQSRLSVESADRVVGDQYNRFNALSSDYVKLLGDYHGVLRQLEEERNKDREVIKIKAKEKRKKSKLKEKGKTHRKLLDKLDPVISALAPKFPALLSQYLPIGLDAANSDGTTPRAAMTRLLKRIFNPDDEFGPTVLLGIKSIADDNGPSDWLMIQQFMLGLTNGSDPVEDEEARH